MIVLGETLRFLESDVATADSSQHPACVAASAVWPSVTVLVSALGAADAVAEAFAANICASLLVLKESLADAR